MTNLLLFQVYFDMWRRALSDERHVAAYCQYIQEVNASLNCYVSYDPQKIDGSVQGLLAGLPVAVKDNIAVKGMPLSCGSALLKDFVSVFDASAVSRIRAAGAQIIGKTNLDEFGMGADTTHSIHGLTRNPWDLQRTPGGSSGGSAAAVASGTVPLALGSDTGGSVRQPASFCGVYGLKPSYGSISRYGLVAFASSLDVIGILAEDISLLEKAFSLMKGRDEFDQTSCTAPSSRKHQIRRVGILALQDSVSSEVMKNYESACEELRAQGITLEGIVPTTLQYVAPTYHIISTAEASTNLARFDGIRYGTRHATEGDVERMILETRSAGFGHEAKMRILLGTYVLRSGFFDQYYGRAQKVRTAICREWNGILDTVDAVLLPVYPIKAFVKDETMNPVAEKSADIYTALANLTGQPALAYPVDGDGNVPIGVQLMGKKFSEASLLHTVAMLHKDSVLSRPAAFPGFAEWMETTGS